LDKRTIPNFGNAVRDGKVSGQSFVCIRFRRNLGSSGRDGNG